MPEPNRICEQCQTPFYSPQWRIKKGYAKYCSRACLDKTRKHPWSGDVRLKMSVGHLESKAVEHKIAMICDNCGREFWEYPKRRARPLKFCNRACCLEFQRGKVPSTETDRKV